MGGGGHRALRTQRRVLLGGDGAHSQAQVAQACWAGRALVQTHSQDLLVPLVVPELLLHLVHLVLGLLQRLCQAPVLRAQLQHILLQVLLLLAHALHLVLRAQASGGSAGALGLQRACPQAGPAGGTHTKHLDLRHVSTRRSAHVSLALNFPGRPIPRDHASVQGTTRGTLHCGSPIAAHTSVTVTLPAPCAVAPRAPLPEPLPTRAHTVLPLPTHWLGRRPDCAQPQVWTGELASTGRGTVEHI